MICSWGINFISINGMIGWGLKACITFALANLSFASVYYRTEEFRYLFNILKNIKQVLKRK